MMFAGSRNVICRANVNLDGLVYRECANHLNKKTNA